MRDKDQERNRSYSFDDPYDKIRGDDFSNKKRN